MASTCKDRSGFGALVVIVFVCSFRATSVLAGPFYYPLGGYQPQAQYYYSDPRMQPGVNSNSYYHQPSVTAQESQNVASYTGNPNYYGLPGYDDQRYISARNSLNDPYARWRLNNYYGGYYYPNARWGGWNDRRDDSSYYGKSSSRRQDAVQTTTTQRPRVPRKKKLFVPNVWG